MNYSRYREQLASIDWLRCPREPAEGRHAWQAFVTYVDPNLAPRCRNDVMEYLEMDPGCFMELCDKFRSPHLWVKVDGEWKLRHTVNKDGVDD